MATHNAEEHPRPTQLPADKRDREHKSTSIPFAIHELDEEDCLIIRLDRKDPARRKIMSAIQTALESLGHRTDDATRAKSYAAERLPDDWRRKMPARDPNDPNETRAYRKPGESAP
jgi:hypothetical protein